MTHPRRPTCTRLREGRPCGRPSDKGSSFGWCLWYRAELRTQGLELMLNHVANVVMQQPLEESE